MSLAQQDIAPADLVDRDRPRLAVVISCYNYGRFVERAIRSVTSQASPHCELVVVDDGSSDDSWSKIAACGVRAYSKANGGQISACLYGLERTRAPFVLFLDADDEMLPGSIAAILSRLDRDVAKLQFPLLRIDGDGVAIGDAFPRLAAGRERAALAHRVARTGVYTSPPTSGNVFRRDLCALLHDVDYEAAVDGAILFAAPFLGDVVSVAEPLGCYRIHGDNDSGLGGLPTAELLKRDQIRFARRVEHIRGYLAGRRPDVVLDDPVGMPYYLEKEIQHAVMCGTRPTLRATVAAMRRLSDLSASTIGRGSLALFFATAYCLPAPAGRLLLMLRLSGLKSFYERRVRRVIRARARPRPAETTRAC